VIWEALEIPGAVLLVVIAYAVWRSCRVAKHNGRRRNGRRRDIWDEVEGRITSVEVRHEAVVVGYEFLTSRGSHQAVHTFNLDVSEPYHFGTREADVAHAAERYLRAYVVGGAGRVRYNPKKVADSVLTRPRAQAAPAASQVAESPAI
jgi:hypothetical protein